jgi:hypothetical protein
VPDVHAREPVTRLRHLSVPQRFQSAFQFLVDRLLAVVSGVAVLAVVSGVAVLAVVSGVAVLAVRPTEAGRVLARDGAEPLDRRRSSASAATASSASAATASSPRSVTAPSAPSPPSAPSRAAASAAAPRRSVAWPGSVGLWYSSAPPASTFST